MSGVEFETILNDAIDETMSRLGETVRRTLSFYLERNFNLKREDVPQRPGDFDSALNALLGSGAAPLEKSIILNLSIRIDVNITTLMKNSEEHFPEAVSRAEELYRTRPRS